MNSYPFTSQVTYDEQGLPLYDRAVDSEFLRQVNRQYYSDGVFYDQSDRLQVVADTGMQVKVMPGCAHIQGAIGIETQQRTLQVQAADEQDRIDTVVVRLDLSLAVRSIDLYILKGAPAESPQPPALTRDSTTWELGLANLFIAQNTATVSQQRITDTRLDTSRCGVVGATAQPPFDTDAYFAQLEAAISAHQKDAKAQILQLQQAIAAVEGNSAWMMRDLYDPQGKGMDVTVQTYTHTREGTQHTFSGSGANGCALMTADVQAGDTFAVNGKAVTAYMGTETAVDEMVGSTWTGKWISFIYDAERDTLNFKGGGGLGSSKLSAATAATGNVLSGKTFYSGDKTLKTGTMPSRASVSTASAVTYDGVRVMGRFPNGYYPNYDSSGAALYLPNANVASAIGLTAAKLVQGQSVLGLTGTGFTQPFYVGYNLYPTYGTFNAGKAPYTGTLRFYWGGCGGGSGKSTIDVHCGSNNGINRETFHSEFSGKVELKVTKGTDVTFTVGGKSPYLVIAYYIS